MAAKPSLLGVQAAYNRWLMAKRGVMDARDTFDGACRRAYEEGATMMDLAETLGVTYHIVRDALVRAGTQMRPRGRKEGTYGE